MTWAEVGARAGQGQREGSGGRKSCAEPRVGEGRAAVFEHLMGSWVAAASAGMRGVETK